MSGPMTGMKSTSHRTSVTLCCAREDVAHLQPLVEHLSRNGIPARLLPGIDEDPHALGPAIDDERGACVFVACIGESLGPNEFRRMTGVYSARRGPQHYLADLLVEPDEILAMAETINTAVRRAQKATAAPRREIADRSGSHRREVVAVTNISAVGSDAIPNSNARRRRRKTPEPEPQSSRSGAYALSGKQVYGRSKSPPSDAAVAAAPSRKRPKIEVIEGGRRPGASTSNGELTDVLADSAASGSFDGLAESSTTGRVADIEETPETDPPFDSQVRPIVVPSHSPNKWMPVVLFIILIAVALTAVIVYIGDQGKAEPSTRVVVQKPLVASPAGPSDGPNAEAGAEAGAEAEVPGATTNAQTEAEAEAETETEQAEPSTVTELEEVAIISEAIESGEMRAVDLIVVAEPGPIIAWRDASTMCRSKSHRGVRGWRLPTLDELKTLREARMLERDRYWSSTLAKNAGTGSDHVYVLDLEARTIEPVAKDAADVRLRCVRPLATPSLE